MYSVTQDYKDNIFADARSVTGRVTFDISPVNIESETPTVTTSSEFFISKAATQISDNIRQATYPLITWETNRNKLDGSFSFASDNNTLWEEVGWVSAGICDANKQFSTIVPIAYPPAIISGEDPETITLQYSTSYTSAGLTITFDPLFGEYATDFTITAYNASNVVVFTQSITNNTLTQYTLINQILNFRKIKIDIEKWSVPYRRARVAEIDAGVVLVYTDEELIKMSLTEEMDPLSSNLVIPEFSFTVDNSNGEFDILNPTGIYQSLQVRQRIQAELGLELTTRTEWVPLGVYFLSEWKSDAGSLTATFKGRSKLDLLDTATFEQLTPQTSYTIYMLIQAILNAAGITGYSIDTALQSISTNGLMEKKTCREALQMAAIAGKSRIFITRSDILTIKTVGTTPSAVSSVTFDDMFEEPQIELGKPVLSSTVYYYTSIGAAAGSYIKSDPLITKGETIVLENNTLINSAARAQAVAEWLYDTRNNQKTFTFDYRGNPSLELNDVIASETRYVASQNITLLKNELNYEGFLTAKIEGRA